MPISEECRAARVVFVDFLGRFDRRVHCRLESQGRLILGEMGCQRRKDWPINGRYGFPEFEKRPT